MEKTIRTYRRSERERNFSNPYEKYEHYGRYGRRTERIQKNVGQNYRKRNLLDEDEKVSTAFTFKITICGIAIAFVAFAANINSDFTNYVTASIKNTVSKNFEFTDENQLVYKIADFFSDDTKNITDNKTDYESENFRIDERIIEKINNEKDEYAEFQKK